MSHLDVITDHELDQLEISLAKWEKGGSFTPVHELLRRAVCTIRDGEGKTERKQKEIDELTQWIDDHNCEYQ